MSDGLERRLGLVELTCIVIGAIVGVGIFFQPRAVVDITGSRGLAMACWAIGGGIAVIGSLTFAELGRLVPKTGGQYHVLRMAYGRPVGFLYCWSLLTVIQSGAIAIIAIIFVQFAARFAAVALAAWAETTLAVAAIAGLAFVNVLGVRQGSTVATVTTALKIVILLAVVGACFLLDAEGPLPSPKTPRGDGRWPLLFAGVVPVLFSFGGWQQGIYLAGEVKEPERNLPRGIIGGVGVVIFLYLAFNAALFWVLDVESMVGSTAPVVDALRRVGGDLASRLVGLGVAVSAFGVASVCIMTAPRMYKAIADDRCFFRPVGRVDARFGTPAVAVVVQGLVAAVLAIVGGQKGIDYLTTGVVCIDWIFFFLTGLALFILRRRLPPARHERAIWGYPILPALFVVLAAGAVVATFLDEQKRSASIVALVVFLSGVAAFFGLRRDVE